jgi:phosphatidate cytidylyltransferase
VRSETPADVTQVMDVQDDVTQDDDDDDDAWYDSGALAPIDEILGEEPDEDTDDELDEDVPAPAATTELPASDEPALPFSDDVDDVDDVEVSTVEAPSEEDLEAAAEHFAGSFRDEEEYPTEPLDVFAGVEDDDAFSPAPGSAEQVEGALLADLEPQQAPRTIVVGAEGVTGPSWQEPASVEVGADLTQGVPGPGERDVPAAFLTGIFLAVLAVVTLWLGEAWFAAFAGLAVLVAQGEFFGVLVKHRFAPAAPVGLIAGVLMMAGAYLHGESATPAMFALGVMAAVLWFMTVPLEHRTDVVKNIGATVLNMAWIPLLAGYLIATLNLPDGRALVFAVVLLTFLFDTAAFVVGSISGGGWFRRPLAPNVSPKKSWEGVLGGAFATAVASVAFVTTFVEPFADKKLEALALGLVIALAATLGDLAESLIKRDIGVKDMGTLLPGHGGVLDRIDSLLFVAPATYLLFRVIFA